MGELRKRGNVWWMRYYRNGRRFEESARTDNYETARDTLKTIEGDIAKGVPKTARRRSAGLRCDEDAAADLETDYTINARTSTAHVQRHVAAPDAVFRRASHGGYQRRGRAPIHRRAAEEPGAAMRPSIASSPRSDACSASRSMPASWSSETKIKLLTENKTPGRDFSRMRASRRRPGAPLAGPASRDRRSRSYTGWRKSEILGARVVSAWTGKLASSGSTWAPPRTRTAGSFTIATSTPCEMVLEAAMGRPQSAGEGRQEICPAGVSATRASASSPLAARRWRTPRARPPAVLAGVDARFQADGGTGTSNGPACRAVWPWR